MFSEGWKEPFVLDSGCLLHLSSAIDTRTLQLGKSYLWVSRVTLSLCLWFSHAREQSKAQYVWTGEYHELYPPAPSLPFEEQAALSETAAAQLQLPQEAAPPPPPPTGLCDGCLFP